MAEYITDKVASEVIDCIRSVFYKHQEAIDTTFDESVGEDEESPKPRKVSVSINLNLVAKGEQIKSTITVVYTPKKVKERVDLLIDPYQMKLPIDGEA